VRASRNSKFRVRALSTALFVFLSLVNADFAHAVTYSFQNTKLRFGTGAEDSLNATGTMQQPFYKSASTFYKLTFASYPLDIAIGVGGVSNGGYNLNGTVATTNGNTAYSVTSHTADYTGFISTPGVAANSGYGVITSKDVISVGGQSIEVTSRYSLGVNDAYIKIQNTLRNLSGASLTNVRTWVGTRDDWVGSSDVPTKTRGNISNGSFAAISNAATQSRAIQINSGSEGVLFYSSSAKAQTSVNSCCSFQNVINQAPSTASITLTNDGSYALFMGMNDVAAGATSETLTWFYAAGAIADLATIVSNVSAANLTLSNLTISEGTLTPAFSSLVTSYSDTITATTTSITVTPTVTDVGVATVKVKANSGTYASVTSGSPSASLAMNTGVNSVYIEVTGGDSATAVTTISVFRPENPTLALAPSFLNATKTFLDTLTVSIGTTVYSPTGTFLFTENGSAISGCSAVVISTGTARCNWTPATTGSRTVVATYSGDNFISLRSDTQTITVSEVVALTSSNATISQKYGSSRTTRVVTYSGGSETKTVSATSLSLASGMITFDTPTALFSIDTRTAVGTYYDTITVTDARGSTASYTQAITITAADTLTVTSDTPTALTYTGSEAVFTPAITVVSGLVSGDVISGATYNYSASVATCAQGGLCSIGQTGPGGGLVFITPTTAGNTTGKYFEAAPSGWSGSGTDPLGKLCTNATSVAGATGTAIGTGETNTNLFAANAACGPSVTDTATALVLNSKDDWFIPSFDELKAMFSALHKAAGGALGGFNTSGTVDYLSSSDNPSGVAPSGTGYSYYGWFGSSDGVAGWGSTSKTSSLAYRPVRSFLATSTSTVNYGPSTTKPTNAAAYTITPSALTFSSGATSNYAAITYQTSTLTINKAAQATLVTTPLYNVFNGSPTTATLLSTGGSDTGTVTYAYVALSSTASGCALSGADSSTVTVTSAGTCRIVATKAATDNYLVAVSDTGTVTFYLYVTNIPAPRAAEYPAEIVLSGATAMTSNGLAPTITFTGADISAAPGGSFTISGTGFVGTRLVRVSGTNAVFTVLSDTSLQITMPTGLVGISGPIYVEKAEGSRASEDWVVGTA
jgi:hypothetical protein